MADGSSQVDVKITFDNLSKIREAFERMPQRTVQVFGEAVSKSTLAVESNAKKEAPVNKGPGGGQLRQRIQSRMITKLTGMVVAAVNYSGAVETGTRPHLIVPVRARVLAAPARVARGWTGKISKGGYAIFGTVVHHPGTKPNPFMHRAVERSAKQIGGFFQDAWRTLFSTLPR